MSDQDRDQIEWLEGIIKASELVIHEAKRMLRKLKDSKKVDKP